MAHFRERPEAKVCGPLSDFTGLRSASQKEIRGGDRCAGFHVPDKPERAIIHARRIRTKACFNLQIWKVAQSHFSSPPSSLSSRRFQKLILPCLSVVFLLGNQGSNKNVTDDSPQDVLNVLRAQKFAAARPAEPWLRGKRVSPQASFFGYPVDRRLHWTQHKCYKPLTRRLTACSGLDLC
jgi:hypothetical protein